MTQYTKGAGILLFTIASLVFAGCADESILAIEAGPDDHVVNGEVAVDDLQKMGRTNGSVRVPFKASFSTFPGVPEHACPPSHNVPVVQSGGGTAMQLGKFSVSITFCADPAPFLAGDATTIPYIDGVGTFVSANGDELSFTIEGETRPTDRPGYRLEFQDPFVFTSGTGRFEGLSGSGETDSYNDPDDQTDHTWTGELILTRGR